ncbi:hypothetical protein J7F03_02700 [Streptomyces sp. ISL-43]|uniref:hypothetical protein n=1 Tax=Streptomyces sp. ISL-43 TaxID=2819183 RepID=UPI001BE4F176|nr:hypothetical protein [Streptomyces sp. ISL-43]MBT2446014.1 hypothetical protein [Streptomyces sp. ISL-43]
MHTPPPGPPRPPTRPHGAWYAAPAALLLAALALTGIGVTTGLVLTAGKHFVCDATTECAKTPYEPGYADPAWPHWPFIAAAVCACVAGVTFAATLLARRRSSLSNGIQSPSPWRNHSPRG